MASHLIIGGVMVPFRGNCTTWLDAPAFAVRPGRGARRRNSTIDLIVLHWTGAENPPEQVVKNLRRRGLGVEFICDRNGTIIQCCDASKVDAYNAGRFNARSIGIEIVNYGFRWPASRRWSLLQVPPAGASREVYATRVNGRQRYFADFFLAQKASVLSLVELLVRRYQAVRPCTPMEEDGRPAQRVLTDLEADSFAGVCGHYHLVRSKLDPGTRLLADVGAMLRSIKWSPRND